MIMSYMNYEERLEVAKRLYELSNTEQKTALECIFPELRESEDEKVRKEILQSIRDNMVVIHKDECIAWLEKQGTPYTKRDVDDAFVEGMTLAKDELEKQGEQKPSTEVKPKFKVGDWISNGRYTKLIVGINSDWPHYVFNDGTSERIKDIDKKNHLWTIQEAKAGDVLFKDVMGGTTFIFDGFDSEMAILYSFIIHNDGADVLPYDIGKPNTGIGYIEEGDIIYPATKEQRDLLFSKMHEAGYEWDAEKKELSKLVIDEGKAEMDYCFTKMMNGEKVSSAWSEEDDYNLQCMIAKVTSDIQKGNVGRNQELIVWLKSLKERYTWKPSELPHWKKSSLPNDKTTGFNSDNFCYNGYYINYKELFDKLPKDD